MSQEDSTPQDVSAEQTDPRLILCRVVDVNQAIQSSFARFIESENKSLEDFAMLLREEMSRIELFVPSTTATPQQ